MGNERIHSISNRLGFMKFILYVKTGSIIYHFLSLLGDVLSLISGKNKKNYNNLNRLHINTLMALILPPHVLTRTCCLS
jgi:hypothetical protein